MVITSWRSKSDTPKSIWGCRSIIVTTQLSGVSNPFSTELGRPLSWVMTASVSRVGDRG